MRKRQISGMSAKRVGDRFESILEVVCRINELNLIKIPMGAHYRKVKGVNTLCRLPSCFDFIITKRDEGTVFFDAKTRAEDTISYSAFHDGKSTERQVNTLLDLWVYGENTGFLVWFRNSDKITFFSSGKIAKMEERTAFGPDDGIDLGTISDFRIERLWDEDAFD